METKKTSPVDYISPSAFKMWQKDPEGYYKHYVLKVRDTVFPYAKQMALGSAFDALVKKELSAMYGVPCPDLLGKIEASLRDEAVTNAMALFGKYKECGAFADLAIELNGGFDLKLEFTIQGTTVPVSGIAVPILGIPDYSFRARDTGESFVSDFKVKSGYSVTRVSPTKGYIKFREYGKTDALGRQIWTRYKDMFMGTMSHVSVNNAVMFEDANNDWATAAVFYYALLGEDAYGTKLLLGSVEEVTPTGVASLRMPISTGFQKKLWASVADLWDRLTSGWFFKELPYEESCAKCEMLEKVAKLGSDDVTRSIDSWKK